MSAKQGMVLVVFFTLILSLGSVVYTSQVVSQMKNTQYQYEELLDDYSQLQEMYKIQTTKPQRRYTGNPFGTELWPGQIQSENITGMHWYSYYEGALLNCTDNVLGLGGAELEGDYTTWTNVWSRDYGAGINFDGIHISNIGTVYATDSGWEKVRIKTYAGAEDNREDYAFGMLFHPIWYTSSVNGRYLVAQDSSGVNGTLEIWKDGVMTEVLEPWLDEPDYGWPSMVGMSPNGRYLAIGAMSLTTYEDNLLMLYEGS